MQEVQIKAQRDDVPRVEAALERLGAQAIVIEEILGSPLVVTPGEIFALSRVKGYFGNRVDSDRLGGELIALLNQEGIAADPLWANVADDGWEEAWKEDLQPIAVGRSLLIAPTWCELPPDHPPHVIRLDPGMAFGSGSHPTTQGCLAALEERALHPPGLGYTLDLGTGSAILAIAAMLLGASGVLGTEIDKHAVKVAKANIEANLGPNRLAKKPSPGCVSVRTTACLPEGRYDTIVANILANALQEMLHGLKDPCPPRSLAGLLKPGGCLILSGILQEQTHPLIEACGKAGLVAITNHHHGEWAVITAFAPREKDL
ncbi:MAG: 50S ribosomal protein L11 methyltransferase [Magnetococcales bacterium]|nr:50S ribosomal protein L11 methyltransferase [Magnetococcales bacterium]